MTNLTFFFSGSWIFIRSLLLYADWIKWTWIIVVAFLRISKSLATSICRFILFYFDDINPSKNHHIDSRAESSSSFAIGWKRSSRMRKISKLHLISVSIESNPDLIHFVFVRITPMLIATEFCFALQYGIFVFLSRLRDGKALCEWIIFRWSSPFEFDFAHENKVLKRPNGIYMPLRSPFSVCMCMFPSFSSLHVVCHFCRNEIVTKMFRYA